MPRSHIASLSATCDRLRGPLCLVLHLASNQYQFARAVCHTVYPAVKLAYLTFQHARQVVITLSTDFNTPIYTVRLLTDSLRAG